MKRYMALAIVAVAPITLASFETSGHGGATGIVKERMDLMESMGDALKALAAMMKGEQPYDAEKVRSLALTIADKSGETMTELFPEASLDPPTEALPEIWSDWKRFTDLADQTSAYATALAATHVPAPAPHPAGGTRLPAPGRGSRGFPGGAGRR